MTLVYKFADAIATMEGFFTQGSRAQLNNNPGNLRSWGHYPLVKGFVAFPAAEDGWKALRTQVQKNFDRGLTTREFFGGKPGVYAGYAPSADGNYPEKYAKFVAGKCGIDVDAVLKDIVDG